MGLKDKIGGVGITMIVCTLVMQAVIIANGWLTYNFYRIMTENRRSEEQTIKSYPGIYMAMTAVSSVVMFVMLVAVGIAVFSK